MWLVFYCGNKLWIGAWLLYQLFLPVYTQWEISPSRIWDCVWGPALHSNLQAPCTFCFIASREDIISRLGLRGIPLCELSRRFFLPAAATPSFPLNKAAVYSREGWDGWWCRRGGGCRSFAFSTHSLVNEPESGYCRLSSSGLDSAAPCLIDISFPLRPNRTPPTPHSTFSLITKHWLACQWPGPDLMNTHLMLAHISPLSLSPLLLFTKRSPRGELRI